MFTTALMGNLTAPRLVNSIIILTRIIKLHHDVLTISVPFVETEMAAMIDMYATVKKISRSQLESMIEDALHKDISIDHAVDSFNNTMLHISVMLDHLDCISLLLSCGADTGVRNSNFFTVSDLAEDLGNQTTIQLLNKWECYRSSVVLDSPFICRSNKLEGVKEVLSSAAAMAADDRDRIAYLSTRVIESFEDYFDWTSSTRRFLLKELFEKLRVEEHEEWQRLHQYYALHVKLLKDHSSMRESLVRKQLQLNFLLLLEEDSVRRHRQALIALTDHISHVRYLLSSVARVEYWTGAVQVCVHKGCMFKLWRQARLHITGSKITITYGKSQRKRKRIIAISDLVRLVVITTADYGRVDKSLLLEYAVCRQRSTVHLRLCYVENGAQAEGASSFAPMQPSKLPTADHMARVLKLLNERVEIKCEVDGSRQMEYGQGKSARRSSSAICSPDKPEGRPRRASFSYSSLLFEEQQDMLDLRNSNYGASLRSGAGDLRTSFLSPSSANNHSNSGSFRGRSLSASCSSSGATSAESLSSVASALWPSREDQPVHLQQAQQQPAQAQALRKPSGCKSRHFISALDLASSCASSTASLLRFPVDCVEDVNQLQGLRSALAQSMDERERIQKELEKSVATKEELRKALLYVRCLQDMLAPDTLPGSLFRTDRGELSMQCLVLCLECHSKTVDDSVRAVGGIASAPSLRLDSSASPVSGLEAAEAVRWLTLCRHSSAAPQVKASRGSLGFARCSEVHIEMMDALSNTSSNSNGALGLDLSAADDCCPLSSKPPSLRAFRAIPGSPPALLKDDFEQ
jgi:hypothetical protein